MTYSKAIHLISVHAKAENTTFPLSERLTTLDSKFFHGTLKAGKLQPSQAAFIFPAAK